MDCLDKRSMD